MHNESEKSQSEKAAYCMIVTLTLWKRKTMETVKSSMVAQS